MQLSEQHYFSPSQINTHVTCPFQWKSNILRYPQILTETKYATAGSVIHASIAEYFRAINDNPSKGEIEGTIQTILDRKWDESGLKRMDSRKDKCMKNFVKFENKRRKTWKVYKPTLIEKYVKSTVNGLNYRTIVDAYWKEDGVIIDWKSGKLNTINESEMIQGQVMKMVIEKTGAKVNKVIFVALLTGLDLVMPNVTDGFVETRVQSMFEHVRLNMFPKKKTRLCDWCGHILRCQTEGQCIWM